MFGDHIPPARPGRQIPARSIEGLRDAAARLSRQRPGTGLLAIDTPSGTLPRKPGPKTFHARLAGASPPYLFTEVYGVPTPALWATLPGGRSPKNPRAWDLNMTAGLTGQVVELHPAGSLGEWYWFSWKSKGGSGPPLMVCPTTIHLQDCNGDPISGATVTLYSTNPSWTPVSGTTDSSGNYTLPSIMGSGVGYFDYITIIYDGVTFGGPVPAFIMGNDSFWNCSNVLCYEYDKAIVTVTSPAGTTVTFNTSLPGGIVTTPTAGETVYTFKQIIPCWLDTYYPPFPATMCIQAGGGTYIPGCDSLTLNCNDDVSVDIPMYDYSSDYWGYYFGCDHDCGNSAVYPSDCTEPDGEGPNYRGVFPITLEATFTSGGGGGNFGSLSGVPITLTWDAVNLRWDSGCLSNPTYSGGPYPVLCASSSRVIISGPVGPSWVGSFTSYTNGDCTNMPYDPGCCDFSFFPPICALTAPVDYAEGAFPLASYTITQ